MSEPRTVRCLDCGYTWESTAENPRCSKSECGRSRNVETVEQALTEEQAETAGDEEAAEEAAEQMDAIYSEMDPTDDEPADDDPDDDPDDDDDGGFTPAFKTREPSTSSRSSTSPSPPRLDRDDEESDDKESDDEESTADPAEEVPELEPEQLALVFETTLDLVADRRGEHWKLDDEESQKLGVAWTPVANEYLPYVFREHTQIGIALIATTSIIGPRLMEDKRLREKEAQRERERENGTPGTVREPEPEHDPDEWTAPDQDDGTEWTDETSNETPTGGYAAV